MSIQSRNVVIAMDIVRKYRSFTQPVGSEDRKGSLRTLDVLLLGAGGYAAALGYLEAATVFQNARNEIEKELKQT